MFTVFFLTILLFSKKEKEKEKEEPYVYLHEAERDRTESRSVGVCAHGINLCYGNGTRQASQSIQAQH